MSSLSHIEKLKLEKLLDMSGGYVLDFSNARFAQFVRDSVGKDIYQSRYSVYGDSKAKRLREFWSKESDSVVGKLTEDLIEYERTRALLEEDQAKNTNQQLLEDCQKISARLLGKQDITRTSGAGTEEEFLRKEIGAIDLSSLGFDGNFTDILQQRLGEMEKSLNSGASLSLIFLAGSTLEGILLGVASRNPRTFNQSKTSPKDNQGKIKPLPQWSLSELINVSCDVGYIGRDVKEFSHALRGFRNYIHPYEQSMARFNPDEHTAEICWKVFRAAVADVIKAKK